MVPARRQQRAQPAQRHHVERVQLERLGYFYPDPDSRPGRPVLNRTLTLKDTWAKLQARQGG